MNRLLNKAYDLAAWVSAKTGIRADYLLHFAVCFGLSVIGLWPLALSFGIIKEAWDSREGGSGWSWGDLVADGLGILVGLIIIFLVWI